MPSVNHPQIIKTQWSVVLPTYRRQSVLDECLQAICLAARGRGDIKIHVLDNGYPDLSREVVEKFRESLNIEYIENPEGRGLGHSLTKGLERATGKYVLEINDDAIIPEDLFLKIEQNFDSDERVGIVGVRAIEDHYHDSGGQIGEICSRSMSIIGNFTRHTDHPLSVEHIYGFCFAYRRDLAASRIGHDKTLLSKDYSSGNRIETDQCLSAISAGYRVIYDGSIAVRHLAKPRPDMDERSEKWRINDIRNTLYLFLKHYGLLGRRFLALRYATTHDLGLRSLILRPSMSNCRYFIVGLRGRLSGVCHWLKYSLSLSRVNAFKNGAAK